MLEWQEDVFLTLEIYRVSLDTGPVSITSLPTQNPMPFLVFSLLDIGKEIAQDALLIKSMVRRVRFVYGGFA